jgi:uncharacterized short protein YbdD (DUF466 family)
MRGKWNVRNVGNVPSILELRTFASKFSLSSAGSFLTFRTFPTLLRRIAGMPDYQRHIGHLQRCHPDRAIPTEREYYEEFLATRYQDGPTRCC